MHASNKCLSPVIKHLRRGCLRVEHDTGGTAYRWEISSLAFKGEKDPAGVPATWVTGAPAAWAVQVLEQLHQPGTQFLFARLPHSPGSRKGRADSVLTTSSTNTQLNYFITWVNAYCAGHGRRDAIPAVNGQPWPLQASQFRRTLAWFIARQPGGAIAGALAYRHHDPDRRRLICGLGHHPC